MVFSSVIFIFGFMPIVFVIYLIVNAINVKNVPTRVVLNFTILCASILFYVWGEGILVLIILFSTIIDFICGQLINTGFRRLGLVCSISINLSLLVAFKYSKLFLQTINSQLTYLGFSSFNCSYVDSVILPLGISFYTFQSMSYTVDVFRGRAVATRNLLDFATYVTMFPQLIAGPIIRYNEIGYQLISRKCSSELFVEGIKRFIIGLGKKVLIANTVAAACDSIFSLELTHINTELAWLAAICFTIQIYFDFSGYSDMAIGLGKMLGFSFPENFNYPYISRSMREFWRRWHITLSKWFRDYLYIPLGGNRGSLFRNSINLFVVFFFCGLWHGASWTYVYWGLYHGLFIFVERILAHFNRGRFALSSVILVPYSLIVIIVGWILFRSNSIAQAKVFILCMFGSYSGGHFYSLYEFLKNDTLIAIIAGIVFSLPINILAVKLKSYIQNNSYILGCYESLKYSFIFSVLWLSLIKIASDTFNPFIYFRF